jgi:hypothetical protein
MAEQNERLRETDSEELFDAILGPDEEISEKTAAEIMETYARTKEQLVDNLKARVQKRVKEIRDETGQVPNTLVAMLNNIREYQRERVPKAMSAEDWVSEMFSGAAMPTTHAEPRYAFRNLDTGEVSENDRRILNEMEAELTE